MIRLELERMHTLTIIDALESRRDAYLATAAYHRGEPVDVWIEEVADADEAERIAATFDEALRIVANATFPGA